MVTKRKQRKAINRRNEWREGGLRAAERRLGEIVRMSRRSAEDQRDDLARHLAAYMKANPAAVELATARTYGWWRRLWWALRFAKHGKLDCERKAVDGPVKEQVRTDESGTEVLPTDVPSVS